MLSIKYCQMTMVKVDSCCEGTYIISLFFFRFSKSIQIVFLSILYYSTPTQPGTGTSNTSTIATQTVTTPLLLLLLRFVCDYNTSQVHCKSRVTLRTCITTSVHPRRKQLVNKYWIWNKCSKFLLTNLQRSTSSEASWEFHKKVSTARSNVTEYPRD